MIRIMAEKCDCLEGFQYTFDMREHTTPGAVALMSKIRENYPDRMLFNFAIAPVCTFFILNNNRTHIMALLYVTPLLHATI